jgi:uncharacterized protein YciI
MSKLFSIITHDKPGAHAVRMEKLRDHLAHVEATLDRLAIAGPMRNEAGEFIGSLLVVKADSLEDARAYIEADPYFKADIWSKIDISAFSAAAGDWVGGKTW